MSRNNLKECNGSNTGIQCPWYANYHIKSKYLCTPHTNVKYGFNANQDRRFKCRHCDTIATYCVRSFLFKKYYCMSCFKRKYRYSALYVKIAPQDKNTENVRIRLKNK